MLKVTFITVGSLPKGPFTQIGDDFRLRLKKFAMVTQKVVSDASKIESALPKDNIIIIDEDLGDPSSGGSGFGGDEDQTLVTKEGLKKLKEELQFLKTTRRAEVAQRLKEAISYGDLSENSEYEEAKNEQAFVEGRILELEVKIKSAKIISEKKTDVRHKEVEIGSTVKLLNKSEGDEEETYTIVGSTEADPLDQKISNESPIGKALLGKHKNDTVVVLSPSGTLKYEIVNVS